jgi:perosamine synthetase
MALGIGPGDEVIVTPYTWGQSVAPVLFTGATAVFADIDSKTLTLAPNSVEERISDKTRAIIPVHIFGNPADMDSLCSMAKKSGIAVVSDAAQAIGALSKGRKIGSLGNAACFSLGRGKTVCGGEGGVLVTDDEVLYERAITISQHPLRAFRMEQSPFSDELCWNYRIHPLAAVLAMADLEIADERLYYRKHILDAFHAEFESIPGIDPVYCSKGDTSAAYGIPLTFYRHALDLSRETVAISLQAAGIPIQIGPIRIPIYLRPTFQQTQNWHHIGSHLIFQKGCCPIVEERCFKQELLLFSSIELDKLEMNKVKKRIKLIKKFFKNHFLTI